MDNLTVLQDLVKALEAGNYNAAPTSLVQGSALQREDLSDVMHNVTFGDEQIVLTKMLKVKSVKATFTQWDRQLSYGILGGSAQLEGAVGQEEVSSFVRVGEPMCYYSHVRRVTMQSMMVDTVDGVKSDDRSAQDATKKIAADIEFALWRGKADFSNGGLFDASPAAIPALPDIAGVDVHIRQSDSMRQAKDLMFAAFGSDDTVVIQCGTILQQTTLEDAAVRSAMNHGSADTFLLDPKTLSAYNKVALGKERIILAGSPQEGTGSDLRKQWVAGGVVQLKASRFLSGRTGPDPTRATSPATAAITSTTPASGSTAFKSGEVYKYVVTAVNELGESAASASSTATISADGQYVPVVITAQAAARFFRVYRTAAGGSTYRFVGSVLSNGTTTFTDLGNKVPGFVTGFLIQGDTMDVAELAPYSRVKLAVTDLSQPEAHYRFLTLRMYQPRKNVLVDNLVASF
jgi:predicted secreted protein